VRTPTRIAFAAISSSTATMANVFTTAAIPTFLYGFADLRIGKPEMACPPADKLAKDLLRRLRLDRKAPRH
jgi:hypothetical protein